MQNALQKWSLRSHSIPTDLLAEGRTVGVDVSHLYLLFVLFYCQLSSFFAHNNWEEHYYLNIFRRLLRTNLMWFSLPASMYEVHSVVLAFALTFAVTAALTVYTLQSKRDFSHWGAGCVINIHTKFKSIARAIKFEVWFVPSVSFKDLSCRDHSKSLKITLIRLSLEVSFYLTKIVLSPNIFCMHSYH